MEEPFKEIYMGGKNDEEYRSATEIVNDPGIICSKATWKTQLGKKGFS